MKHILVPFVLATASLSSFATDVGVSVSVNQPGVYGRIDIGRVPVAPAVVYAQPVVITPTPIAVQQQPIYLHVPPGHAKDWGKHCGKYNACGQRVYFVREDWYQQQYVPASRGEGHGRGHEKEKGHGKRHGKHGD